MNRPLVSYVVLVNLLLCTIFLGCGDEYRHSSPSAYLECRFAPMGSESSINVSQIVITIDRLNAEPTVESVSVELGHRQVDTAVVLPPNALGIQVDAYEMDETGQERHTFHGISPIDTVEPSSNKLTIWLKPTTAYLELTASSTEVGVGESFTVEISVNQVNSLSAMAMELGFDSTQVQPVVVERGTFFGPSPVFFDDLALSGPVDRLGIAVGQRGGTVGVDGSGIVAKVEFRALLPGSTSVRIVAIEDGHLTLEQADGSRIQDFERLSALVQSMAIAVDIR